MANMKFRFFQWDHDPEEFGVYAVCEPLYQENDIGSYDYTGMGPMCRVFTGSGIFCGVDAVQDFNTLSVMMATRAQGELSHPIWGVTTAYLTELEMLPGSRPDRIAYRFAFRETDETGGIPKLPEQKVQ